MFLIEKLFLILKVRMLFCCKRKSYRHVIHYNTFPYDRVIQCFEAKLLLKGRTLEKSKEVIDIICKEFERRKFKSFFVSHRPTKEGIIYNLYGEYRFCTK